MDRRSFLNRTATTFVAFGAAAGTASAQRVRRDKANDKVVMGVVGLGGRGRGHSRGFAWREDCEVAYVCDVDEARVGRHPKEVERVQKKKPKAVTDMRRIFDDKDVDAVVVATCDHWHGLATIWACQAGKDVYVEKPPSHNIWEGRKMVEAARKYECVVQVGSQNRSAPYVRAAREYIESGAAGDVPLVKVFNLEGGGPFTCPPDGEMPSGVDYDKYLGPAPMRPFNEAHFHGGWKNYWAYSGGDFADDGIHQLDVARLLMGDKPYPKTVHAMGGNMAFDDDREVPDTQVVSFEYDDAVMTFELSQFARYMAKTPGKVRATDAFPDWPQNSSRIEVYGTKQMLYVGRHGGGWQALTSEGKVVDQGYGRDATDAHRDNFIDCVRTRERPNADIEIGHQSAALVHLGNMGVRLGGRRIEYDGANEAIPGDPQAGALLKREYREPYVVPENV
ncbi:MAG: Gfo/Idh/MocA family oxidoreductase [bacterium]|nr:Gfo/Idh/MocA family oxidoreductase [bacterium]